MSFKTVAVTGPFDDLRSRHVRFLEEASKLGALTVLLWSDRLIDQLLGSSPKFPAAERLYLLKAFRFCNAVRLIDEPFEPNTLPQVPAFAPDLWMLDSSQTTEEQKVFCKTKGVQCLVIGDHALAGFPETPPDTAPSARGRKKVIVTGCYDWFHSGHVRFFEEVSAYGDLYVIVGHDANIRLLKGGGHPLHPEQERRYMVGSVRCVKQALISTGTGWLDAEPEIQRLRPDIYAVNQDGDRGGKREYCLRHGIEYLVLRRTPAPGLRPRSSTELRGF